LLAGEKVILFCSEICLACKEKFWDWSIKMKNWLFVLPIVLRKAHTTYLSKLGKFGPYTVQTRYIMAG